MLQYLGVPILLMEVPETCRRLSADGNKDHLLGQPREEKHQPKEKGNRKCLSASC